MVALRCTEWLPSVTWCSSVSLLCHLNVTWWHLVTLRYQLVAPWWHVVARSITSCHPNVTLVAINVTPVSLWWPLMSPQCHLGGTQWHPKDTPRSHGGIWWHSMAPKCHLLSPQCHFGGPLCHPNVTLVALNVPPMSPWWHSMPPQCHLVALSVTPMSPGATWCHPNVPPVSP